MWLFEVYNRQCIVAGREGETWQDMKEIEKIEMKTYQAAQIDQWMNDKGFFHKEMYRRVANEEKPVEDL